MKLSCQFLPPFSFSEPKFLVFQQKEQPSDRSRKGGGEVPENPLLKTEKLKPTETLKPQTSYQKLANDLIKDHLDSLKIMEKSRPGEIEDLIKLTALNFLQMGSEILLNSDLSDLKEGSDAALALLEQAEKLLNENHLEGDYIHYLIKTKILKRLGRGQEAKEAFATYDRKKIKGEPPVKYEDLK